ncbi:MAG TPA: EutP/PduV family microcompartment system protein [Desulfosporosinus sp.]|nr:EutP/PduV family microcompartment system protein [Desulfosporosinus sp.]
MTDGKKNLFVGSRGCGKTTLILALLDQYDQNTRITSTQGMTSHGPYIDLPGNYCDNPGCYPILSVCSQQAQSVVLVIGADQRSMLMPEGFAHLFIRPVLGVITKIDELNADCERAKLWLRLAGVRSPIYSVSARTGVGVVSFRQFLEKQLDK